MPFLTDIGDYIIANVAGQTKAINFFESEMPDGPDQCAAIFQFPGNPQSRMGNTRSPGLQVRARALAYVDASALIESIFEAMDLIGNEYEDTAPEGIEINGTFYLSFIAQGEPLPIGEDSQGRPELTQNYIVTYKR